MRDKSLSAVKNSIFCALDTDDLEQAVRLAEELKGLIGGVKLGNQFFTSHGPQGVEKIAQSGVPIFLDLKYHDIPNTVQGAVRSAVRLKPFMLNVHASGDQAMMKAAKKAAVEEAARLSIEPPLVIGVTMLTSHSQQYLRVKNSKHPTIAEAVKALAREAKECGLDGVVCSGEELESIRSECGPEFKIVVPALRPPWVFDDDQVRILRPKQAYDKGADYLVIGRPITQTPHDDAATPTEAVQKIINSIINDDRSEELLRA